MSPEQFLPPCDAQGPSQGCSGSPVKLTTRSQVKSIPLSYPAFRAGSAQPKRPRCASRVLALLANCRQARAPQNDCAAVLGARFAAVAWGQTCSVSEVSLRPPITLYLQLPMGAMHPMACFQDSQAAPLLSSGVGALAAPHGLCSPPASLVATVALTLLLAGVPGPRCVRSVPRLSSRVRASAPVFG